MRGFYAKVRGEPRFVVKTSQNEFVRVLLGGFDAGTAKKGLAVVRGKLLKCFTAVLRGVSGGFERRHGKNSQKFCLFFDFLDRALKNFQNCKKAFPK